ncbi:mal, T cell differentiation protein b [Acipenser ruthenus]|uniref:mal, T cell differentiation protein b n=1 Tax=Acipenser ruthenus TaxID=7906 RepID=UPI0027415A5D|nr:mal, T cell differentiation protein b [Acipenser ruthenus]
MATTAQAINSLPSGLGVFTTLPDLFFIPELVFGGLVWILVASTNVYMENPQGWVMFVSVFCFVFTFLWLLLFMMGVNKNNSMWASLDVAYHALAAFFYLSASVALAYVTTVLGQINLGNEILFKYYQEDIAAVVFSYIATLLYAIHAVMSACRWKSL